MCSLVYDVNIFLFLDDDDEESTYEEEDHSQDHHTEVSNDKNPPKIKSDNLWNCLGQTYACNSLTSFWNAAHAFTGNGNYANLLK